MGLDYEEYAKELNRVEMENEARGDYENNDLKNMNQQEEEQPQNDDPVSIKAENRRVQREVPKPKKEDKDDWGDDVENDLGL